MVGYHLFDTSLCRCGIAWNARGLTAFQLIDENDDADDAAGPLRRLRERSPEATSATPPPRVADVIARVHALLAGNRTAFDDVALDVEGLPDFHRRVYEAARRLRFGETTTYGALADALHAPGAARAVGQALGRNPFAVIVPCHRIVASSGKLGGFSAPGGASTKAKLLAIEGAVVPATMQPSLF